MTIEQFVAQSAGKWRSMRSGHSLAFQQFEEVLSEVTIKEISREDSAIKQLIESPLAKRFNLDTISSPFKMEWCAESDWEPDDPSEVSSGSLHYYSICQRHFFGDADQKRWLCRSRGSHLGIQLFQRRYVHAHNKLRAINCRRKNLVCLRECALQVISFKNFSRVRSAANVVCIRSQTN